METHAESELGARALFFLLVLRSRRFLVEGAAREIRGRVYVEGVCPHVCSPRVSKHSVRGPRSGIIILNLN